MKTTVRIILAGVGGYGRNYVTDLLERAAQDPSIELAGFVDPFLATSPDLEQLSRYPCGTDLDAFLGSHEADLLIVSTPIQFHAPQIIAGLRAGMHVLCEKPLCADWAQVEALRVARAAAGKQVGIGYQWAYSPALQAARRDIQAGRYGQPEVLRTRVYWPRSRAYYSRSPWAGRLRTDDGLLVNDSVLNNATAHYLQNMLWFIGEGYAGAAIPDRIDARLARAWPIESFDTALLRLVRTRADGGETVLVMAASHVPEQLIGPELDYRFAGGRIVRRDSRIIGTCDGQSEEIDYGPDESSTVSHKLEAMIAAVRDNVPPPCDIDTAAAQTWVIDALHRSFPIENFTPEQICIEEREGSEWRIVPGLDATMDAFLASTELPRGPLAAG